MSIIDFMRNIDAICDGKNKKRCPNCESSSIKVDEKMEKYNENLATTYYKLLFIICYYFIT